jgi:hypothetical protein
MSVYLELVNHDELFHRLEKPPILANHLDITTLQGKEQLNRQMYNQYQGDTLNVLPSCDCGELQGGYNVGSICGICKTVCLPNMDKPLESLIWFQAPPGVRALINPAAWIIMSKAMTTSGFNLMEWFCNPSYKPNRKLTKQIAVCMGKLELYMERSGIPRGLNSFHDNFDVLMTFAFGLKYLIKSGGPRRDDMQQWIGQNRNKIFSQYLPMPSKVGFVVESSNGVGFVDKTITLAIDALRTVISIENSVAPLTSPKKQARVVKAIIKLAEYYSSFIKNTLGKKPGIFRRHVYGGRTHFSARAVITSNSANHEYDELHIPWSLALQLLRVHLVNKLLKRGYSPVQIEHLFVFHALRYSELFDELFKELIRESPYKGIPVTFGRNPTLARGSIQLFYVTHVKPDPLINTISISTLCLKGPNADFDGDEMNLMLILDQDMHDKLSRLAPHLYALDLGEPRRISSNLQLPGPVVSTIANWLYEGR